MLCLKADNFHRTVENVRLEMIFEMTPWSAVLLLMEGFF